eukprot:scaffold7825_cov162-Amphora_coffeaeformis.AAC.5
MEITPEKESRGVCTFYCFVARREGSEQDNAVSHGPRPEHEGSCCSCASVSCASLKTTNSRAGQAKSCRSVQ